MPHRNFYRRTSDGYLQQIHTERSVTAEFPLQLPSEVNAEHFNPELVDLDDWLSWNNTSELESPSDGLESRCESRYEDCKPGQACFDEQFINAELGQALSDDIAFDIDESCLTVPDAMEVDDGQAYMSTHRLRVLYGGYPRVGEEKAQTLPHAANGTLPNVPKEEAVDSDHSQEPSVRGPQLRMWNKKQKPLPENEKPKRKAFTPSKRQRKSHNAIEKRYRNNLNCKIAALQQTIPSLQEAPKHEEEHDGTKGGEDEATYKYGKAVIITHAIDYIAYLEESTERLRNDAVVIEAQMKAFKIQIARLGAIVLGNAAYPPHPVAETLETIQDDFVQSRLQTKRRQRRDKQCGVDPINGRGPNKSLRLER